MPSSSLRSCSWTCLFSSAPLGIELSLILTLVYNQLPPDRCKAIFLHQFKNNLKNLNCILPVIFMICLKFPVYSWFLFHYFHFNFSCSLFLKVLEVFLLITCIFIIIGLLQTVIIFFVFFRSFILNAIIYINSFFIFLPHLNYIPKNLFCMLIFQHFYNNMFLCFIFPQWSQFPVLY